MIDLLIPEAVNFIKKVREMDDKVILMALTRDSSVQTLMSIVDLYFSSYLIKPVSEHKLRKEIFKISKNIDEKDRLILPYFCQWDIKSKTLFHKDKVIPLTKRESKLF